MSVKFLLKILRTLREIDISSFDCQKFDPRSENIQL